MKNNLRISNLCQATRNEYDVIIVSAISPYEGVRKIVRTLLELDSLLIFLKSDLDSLKERDTKGLYTSADNGIINDLIGYSDVNPYEEPCNAEKVIRTDSHVTIEESSSKFVRYINRSILMNNYLS
jgi:adenylylsulfate kinase